MAPAGRTPGADAGDAELVAAARAGDGSAFAALYDRYADRLHGFCVGMLRDRDEAADATHDTFLLAARKLHQLRDPALVRPWLYAIARNECIRRGRQRARMVPTEGVGDMVGVEEADPTGGLGAEEVAALLWAAADGLDERDRLLLELSVRHGLEGAELADAAGIQPGQISMAVGRMRERVERSLGALLIARQGSADCADLRTVLFGWDGTFTVLMRKRVARHVESCSVCEERRRGLVASMASVAGAIPFLPAPAGLRARVMSSVDGLFGGPTAGGPTAPTDGWLPSGFPPLLDDEIVPGGPAEPGSGRRGPRRRAALVAVAAAVIVALIAAVLLTQTDDGPDTVLAAAGLPTTTTTTPVPASAPAGSSPSSATGPTLPSHSTVTGPQPTTPAGSAPSTATAAPPGGGPAPTSGPSGATTAPPPGTDGVPTTAPTDPTRPATTAPRPTTTRPAPTTTRPTTTTSTTTTTTTTTTPNQPPTLSRVLVSTTKPLYPQGCAVAPTAATVSATVTDDRGITSVVLVETKAGVTTEVVMTLANGRWRATLGPFATPGVVTWQVRATDTDGATATSDTGTTTIQRCPR